MGTNFLVVDFQRDFISPGGEAYRLRESVAFVRDTLVPYFLRNRYKTAEILSDYRQPRLGDSCSLCVPGEWGFEPGINREIITGPSWIKAHNSPLWIRENRGTTLPTSLPYPAPEDFRAWLTQVGFKQSSGIVLFGLTLDCCVLATAQELYYLGYSVGILEEAVDVFSGDAAEKRWILDSALLKNWAVPVRWEEIRQEV